MPEAPAAARSKPHSFTLTPSSARSFRSPAVDIVDDSGARGYEIFKDKQDGCVRPVSLP